MNDYDDNHLMMCEKEDLVQHINYLQGQLQGCQDELTEIKKDESFKKQLGKVNTHIKALHRHYIKNHYDELATDNGSFIWYLCLNDLL